MNRTPHAKVGFSTRPVLAPSVADSEAGALSSPIERDASAAATDWQIILHLRTLFERDPSLITWLLQGPGSNHPGAYATTLLAAAREALTACPDSAELRYHAAMAVAHSGKTGEAPLLLRRVLEPNSRRPDAQDLPPSIRPEPDRPWRRATGAGDATEGAALAPGAAPLVGEDGKEEDWKGNELST